MNDEFNAFDVLGYDAVRNADSIAAPVGNYYGGPSVWSFDGKYYLSVENWDGQPTVEVSKKFHDAFVLEFKGGDVE